MPKAKPSIAKILIKRVSNFPDTVSKATPASAMANMTNGKLVQYRTGKKEKTQAKIPEMMLAQPKAKLNFLWGRANRGKAKANEYPQTIQKVLPSVRAFLQKGQSFI